MREVNNIEGSGRSDANINSEIAPIVNDLISITDEILLDARTDISTKNTISMPIAQLAMLGAGVSSLIPALRTVTETTTVSTQGLYQLANASVGDALKVAQNGNFWGAFKTAERTSKLAQLQAAGPLSAINKTVIPIDPATMMMAVALFSIEQQLGNIVEMEKQILSFLEIEKESETEADVETLADIIEKYKFNWDNEHFIASNHKMVLDIQRTARKHMNSYKKTVNEVLNSKQFIVSRSQVNSSLKDLQKKFKYYRLSLYTYSMASLIEVMLSGNFKEENIAGIKTELENLSNDYRNLYEICSVYLEKISMVSLENNVLKGIGNASEAVGKLIGSIPSVKNGPVDEFLQEGGSHLKSSAKDIEMNLLHSFAEFSNPGIRLFIDKMDEMIKIYNHTSEICFDDKRIYILAC